MELNFTGTVTSISQGPNNSIDVTIQLESGTGIKINVIKASEKDFTIGQSYQFVGNPS